MKSIKSIFILMFVGVLSVLLVACQSQNNVLNDLVNSVNNLEKEYNTYIDKDLENELIKPLASYQEYETIKLSSNDLVTFNETRLALKATHLEILTRIETIKSLIETIKTNINTLKNLDYIFLEDDLSLIKEKISILTELRTNLLNTRGQAYQRLYELKGSYTRENLTEIIIVFNEVHEVLNYRLETLELGIVELNEINEILLEYMENWDEN